MGGDRRSSDQGFSLIELLVVIIVLGVLASIVVFSVTQTAADALQSTCRAQLGSIAESAASVHAKQAKYPADETGLTTPAPWALLKSWPSSSDYTFTYTQVGGGSDYSIEVSGPRLAGGTVTSNATTAEFNAACASTG